MIDRTLHLTPITVRLRTPFRTLAHHLECFYTDAETQLDERCFVDFDILIAPGSGLRRLIRPQARFLLDGGEPFLPLPATQAAPLFEWGLNWALASRPLGYLIMHAAVVARDDAALVMPGEPGAGKSTLCAALTFLEEWRLLSDELAILDPESGRLKPCPRPICLKNESIVIVGAMPGTRLGPVYHDTRKGSITHAAAPAGDQACAQPARCRWIVFPRFSAATEPYCEELSKAETFARIAEQSFNRDRMGDTGFHALCQMLGGARCFEIGYRSTEEAIHRIRELTGH